jgi:transcriptional regulator MraZ
MLLGEYSQAVDDRGQFQLPGQFLHTSGGSLVLTRGFDENLLLFGIHEWRDLAEKLVEKPISSPEIRALRRRLFSAAALVAPELNGRLTIPATLRNFARINGDLIIVGMYDHLELWSPQNWRKVVANAEAIDEGRWQASGL